MTGFRQSISMADCRLTPSENILVQVQNHNCTCDDNLVQLGHINGPAVECMPDVLIMIVDSICNLVASDNRTVYSKNIRLFHKIINTLGMLKRKPNP